MSSHKRYLWLFIITAIVGATGCWAFSSLRRESTLEGEARATRSATQYGDNEARADPGQMNLLFELRNTAYSLKDTMLLKYPEGILIVGGPEGKMKYFPFFDKVYQFTADWESINYLLDKTSNRLTINVPNANMRSADGKYIEMENFNYEFKVPFRNGGTDSLTVLMLPSAGAKNRPMIVTAEIVDADEFHPTIVFGLSRGR